jgi:hypothetical protein
MAFRTPRAACLRVARFAKPEVRATAGGFETRKVAALAHLREAYLSADPENARAVEDAVRALVGTHSASPTLDYQVLRGDAFDVGRWMDFLSSLWAPNRRRAVR